MHHPTDRIAHTTAFVTPVVEHWLEREIAQWVKIVETPCDRLLELENNFECIEFEMFAKKVFPLLLCPCLRQSKFELNYLINNLVPNRLSFPMYTNVDKKFVVSFRTNLPSSVNKLCIILLLAFCFSQFTK